MRSIRCLTGHTRGTSNRTRHLPPTRDGRGRGGARLDGARAAAGTASRPPAAADRAGTASVPHRGGLHRQSWTVAQELGSIAESMDRHPDRSRVFSVHVDGQPEESDRLVWVTVQGFRHCLESFGVTAHWPVHDTAFLAGGPPRVPAAGVTVTASDP